MNILQNPKLFRFLFALFVLGLFIAPQIIFLLALATLIYDVVFVFAPDKRVAKAVNTTFVRGVGGLFKGMRLKGLRRKG